MQDSSKMMARAERFSEMASKDLTPASFIKVLLVIFGIGVVVALIVNAGKPSDSRLFLSSGNIQGIIKDACLSAWYNNGGDSDRESYFGDEYKNDKVVSDGTVSVDYPVIMHSLQFWITCEYDIKADGVVQITDDTGIKLFR